MNYYSFLRYTQSPKYQEKYNLGTADKHLQHLGIHIHYTPQTNIYCLIYLETNMVDIGSICHPHPLWNMNYTKCQYILYLPNREACISDIIRIFLMCSKSEICYILLFCTSYHPQQGIDIWSILRISQKNSKFNRECIGLVRTLYQ